MKVKDLRRVLINAPDDYEVFFRDSDYIDYAIGFTSTESDGVYLVDENMENDDEVENDEDE